MILQDRIVYLMRRGMDIEFIKALDLLSFGSLVKSCFRLDASEKIEAAYTALCAAQYPKEAMDEHVKIWEAPEQETNDADKLLKRFPQGI